MSAARIVLAAAAVLAFGYLGLLATLYLQQRRLLFPATRIAVTAAEAGLAGFVDATIDTPDGERLQAWWRPPAPGRALIVYFHGNGGSLWNRRDRAGLLTRGGRGLLMVSYRGYGGSTGEPSEEGLHADAAAALAWLARYQPGRIVLYGESLGTGVAIRLAGEAHVGGLVLDAPYTSTADVAKALFPYAPVGLLMRDTFRSLDRIGRVRAPLLVMHGGRDGVIPIAQGRATFAAANEPKRMIELPDVDHSGVLERGGLAPLETFLEEIEAGLPNP